MLSPLWWLPLLVAALAAAALWRGVRQLQAQSAGLTAATEELRRLRPLVAEVQGEIATSARAAARANHDLASR
jgi:hypothetical protein